jgi:hypothetical protein
VTAVVQTRSARYRPELETALYRIVQEGLTNALHHARASAVAISVDERDGRIRASVSDNGQGFDLALPDEGFGLIGMRERVALLRGDLEIVSAVIVVPSGEGRLGGRQDEGDGGEVRGHREHPEGERRSTPSRRLAGKLMAAGAGGARPSQYVKGAGEARQRTAQAQVQCGVRRSQRARHGTMSFKPLSSMTPSIVVSVWRP